MRARNHDVISLSCFHTCVGGGELEEEEDELEEEEDELDEDELETGAAAPSSSN